MLRASTILASKGHITISRNQVLACLMKPNFVKALIQRGALRWTASMPSIDSSGVHTLKEVIDDYNRRGITLYLTGVIGPVRDTLDRAGIMQYLGEEHFFLDISEAITYREDTRKKPIKDYTLQTFR